MEKNPLYGPVDAAVARQAKTMRKVARAITAVLKSQDLKADVRITITVHARNSAGERIRREHFTDTEI